MKKLISALSILLFLSSCMGGLYSHYPKAKKNQQKMVVLQTWKKKNSLFTNKHSPEVESKNIPIKLQPANNAIIYTKVNIPVRNKNPCVKGVSKLNHIITTAQEKINTYERTPLPKKVKTRSIISLIAAIAGTALVIMALALPLHLLILYAFPFEIVAIVNGARSLEEIRKNNYKGRGMALAAIILSSIFFTGLMVYLLVVIIFILILIGTYIAWVF